MSDAPLDAGRISLAAQARWLRACWMIGLAALAAGVLAGWRLKGMLG